jgi:nicotinamide-nucleotide amidase
MSDALSTADIEELARRTGQALASAGAVLVTVESCTGGWVAQAITAVAGSSAWFDRGFVTYSNAAKVDMVGVREATLERYGAVSEPTVREMASGALRVGRGSIAVAISGVAGPGGGSPHKPVGTVCLAWASRDPASRSFDEPVTVDTVTLHLPGDRTTVRARAVRVALEGVIERLAVRQV